MCCGCHHSAVISTTGQLYTWGLNLDGQLGVSGIRERLVPTVTLVGPPSVIVDSSSTSGSLIKEVRCGADFTLALDAANKLWGWGSNHEGQVSIYSLIQLLSIYFNVFFLVRENSGRRLSQDIIRW